MAAPTLDNDMALAHDLIDVASGIALRHFGTNVEVSRKRDGTPVSKADLEVESALVEILRRERPYDSILSEESGVLGTGGRKWIIDPIDGTWNFISSKPSWGTHVALETDCIRLGIVSRPALSARWWAVIDGGAYVSVTDSREDAAPICVSPAREPGESRVTLWGEDSNSTIAILKERFLWSEPSFEAILDVAEGSLEACIDTTGKAWDLAPYVRLIEEAGGVYSDLSGGRSIELGGGCFSNGDIHAEILQALSA